MLPILFVALTTWASSSCHGKLINSAPELTHAAYDYIIVGGGTAGNVIANRLTENPAFSVLVIEAGPTNDGVLDIAVPYFSTRATPDTPWDWNYTSIPQKTLDERVVTYPRGHVFGGSSSVNYLASTRGTKEDWDRYADILEDSSFSWDSMQTYFFRNEKLTPPADHHNTSGQLIPQDHSTEGMVGDSLAGFSHPIDERVIRTTQELPSEFPFNEDMNSGYHLGIGWEIGTAQNGTRSSSATSYMAKQFLSRNNLHVILNSKVTRLRQLASSAKGSPVFRSVELMQDNKPIVLNATKEVILSAGAINTPMLLLNSGIGSKNALGSAGIKTVVDLPSVGQNLTDHPIVALSWLVNSTDTFDTLNRNATVAAEALAQWNQTRTGPLVDNVANQLGWLRLPSDASIFKTFSDPAAGPNTAHFEMIYINGVFGPEPATGFFFSISTAMVAPLSRGSVTLNASNPLGPPLIDLNFYDSEFDLFTMREALRSSRRFAAAPAWSDYITAPLTNASTDAELDAYIRNVTIPIYHGCGTAAMSPAKSNWGVVNPDFTVKSVQGLRIVDASVLPRIPAAHTATPVYAFAEKAADAIKASWK